VGGLAPSRKRKDDPCHWQWFGVAHLKQDSMRTFMAQKSYFRTLNANGCRLLLKHRFQRRGAVKGNGVNTSYCVDAMEAKITF